MILKIKKSLFNKTSINSTQILKIIRKIKFNNNFHKMKIEIVF